MASLLAPELFLAEGVSDSARAPPAAEDQRQQEARGDEEADRAQDRQGAVAGGPAPQAQAASEGAGLDRLAAEKALEFGGQG